MGLILGKNTVETPKYEVRSTRLVSWPRLPTPLPSSRATGMAASPSSLTTSVRSGHPVMFPPENIAMTAPAGPEKISMTAPVITKENGGGGEMTMQFVLPAKYRHEDKALRPEDERVLVKDVGERKFGVVKFIGVATEEVVKEKVGRLGKELEKGRFKVVGEWLLSRYNPPWTLPKLRTNEVMVLVE